MCQCAKNLQEAEKSSPSQVSKPKHCVTRILSEQEKGTSLPTKIADFNWMCERCSFGTGSHVSDKATDLMYFWKGGGCEMRSCNSVVVCATHGGHTSQILLFCGFGWSTLVWGWQVNPVHGLLNTNDMNMVPPGLLHCRFLQFAGWHQWSRRFDFFVWHKHLCTSSWFGLVTSTTHGWEHNNLEMRTRHK